MSGEVTRIAPSPTGFMHVGTARTALFNWLVAKTSDGKFILRMDDTDVSRNVVEAEQPIFDGLKWLGLEWDEFHRQSKRLGRYTEVAEALVTSQLAKRLDNGAISLSSPELIPELWEDSVVGTVHLQSGASLEQLRGGLILIRGENKSVDALAGSAAMDVSGLGSPTYNFASIVDDMDLGITHIIRGKDHIDNTAKQLYVKAALEHAGLFTRQPIRFSHVGLIFANGKKMSKRDGAASLLDYRDKGYAPLALLNHLLRIGWGPKLDNKANSFCRSVEQILDVFSSGGRFRASECDFNSTRLDSFAAKCAKL